MDIWIFLRPVQMAEGIRTRPYSSGMFRIILLQNFRTQYLALTSRFRVKVEHRQITTQTDGPMVQDELILPISMVTGLMNASFVSGRYLYALDENLQLLWRIVINEETSGYTGCTLFDFNGDGSSEIVYRDEQFIYILNGADGSIYNQQRCVSRTYREYPIVADVDADGSTEICVPCGFDDQLATDNFCNLSYSQNSHIRVFKSNSEPWVPARRLWNQHGYFNVNVNDDLTIPRVMQKHHLGVVYWYLYPGSEPTIK